MWPNTFVTTSPFVLNIRKKTVQVWSDMRMSKWWQMFILWWPIPLNLRIIPWSTTEGVKWERGEMDIEVWCYNQITGSSVLLLMILADKSHLSRQAGRGMLILANTGRRRSLRMESLLFMWSLHELPYRLLIVSLRQYLRDDMVRPVNRYIMNSIPTPCL